MPVAQEMAEMVKGLAATGTVTGTDDSASETPGVLEKLSPKDAGIAALVEIHVDDFECNVLGAVITHQSGGLQLAQPSWNFS